MPSYIEIVPWYLVDHKVYQEKGMLWKLHTQWIIGLKVPLDKLFWQQCTWTWMCAVQERMLNLTIHSLIWQPCELCKIQDFIVWKSLEIFQLVKFGKFNHWNSACIYIFSLNGHWKQSWHDTNFVNTCGIGGCHSDNLHRYQPQQLKCHHNNCQFSVEKVRFFCGDWFLIFLIYYIPQWSVSQSENFRLV